MPNLLLVPVTLLVVLLSWGSVRADDNVEFPAVETREAAWLSKIKGNADAVDVNGKVLKYQFNEIPKSDELRFPRLFARLDSVFWMNQPEKLLTLKPGITEWTVKLVNPTKGEKILVVKLLDDDAPNAAGVLHLNLSPQEKVELTAHTSMTHGDKLRYEPQPHKNTVGYWTNPDDWVSWTLGMTHKAKFHVDILQGCGTGQGGSEVRVLITQKKKTIDEFSFIVEDTGHFQNFKERRIGTFSFPTAGSYQLEIRPKNLAKNAVMDVRKVILVPVQD